MKKTLALVLFAVIIVPAAAFAQTYSFDVDGKFVNIAFESRMDVEDILGTSHSVSGHVRLTGDSGGSFKLEVPVDTLKTGIDMRDEHLRPAHWLDAEKHPKISFEGDSVRSLGNGKYAITGNFTLHGVSRELTVTIDSREIPKERAASLGMGDTAWMRVRGEFTVKLSDFGVRIPGMAAAKVNDEWTVKVSLFAKGE